MKKHLGAGLVLVVSLLGLAGLACAICYVIGLTGHESRAALALLLGFLSSGLGLFIAIMTIGAKDEEIETLRKERDAAVAQANGEVVSTACRTFDPGLREQIRRELRAKGLPRTTI